jgi:hypothetical protein
MKKDKEHKEIKPLDLELDVFCFDGYWECPHCKSVEYNLGQIPWEWSSNHGQHCPKRVEKCSS